MRRGNPKNINDWNDLIKLGIDIVTPNPKRSGSPRFADQFADVSLVTIDDVFGGWSAAQKKHFSDGGIFDEIIVK